MPPSHTPNLDSGFWYQANYHSTFRNRCFLQFFLFALLMFLAGCTSFESMLQNTVKEQIAKEVFSGKSLLIFQFKENELEEDPSSWHGNSRFMHQPRWGLANIKTGEVFPGGFQDLSLMTPPIGQLIQVWKDMNQKKFLRRIWRWSSRQEWKKLWTMSFGKYVVPERV